MVAEITAIIPYSANHDCAADDKFCDIFLNFEKNKG